MKIIDLLVKIANGEEPPKKIKRLGYTFIYTGDIRPQRFYKFENQDNYLLRDTVYALNDEVEIIEEKKIPEKLNYPHIEIESSADDEIRDYLYKVKDKFDEIIDYLQSKGDE